MGCTKRHAGHPPLLGRARAFGRKNTISSPSKTKNQTVNHCRSLAFVFSPRLPHRFRRNAPFSNIAFRVGGLCRLLSHFRVLLFKSHLHQSSAMLSALRQGRNAEKMHVYSLLFGIRHRGSQKISRFESASQDPHPLVQNLRRVWIYARRALIRARAGESRSF